MRRGFSSATGPDDAGVFFFMSAIFDYSSVSMSYFLENVMAPGLDFRIAG